MDEDIFQGLTQHRGRTEIHVVAEGLIGQIGVQRVMHIVGPLRVHAHAAGRPRLDHGRLVQVGFGDQRDRTGQAGPDRVHPLGQLGQDVLQRLVDQGMHGVQPQRVDVELAQPADGVLADEIADAVGVLVVQVDSRSPRRVVLVGEIGREDGGVVAGGPEVVVDDIQADRQAASVRGVHEALQRCGSAIGFMHGIQVHPVVSPATVTRKRHQRHQFNGLHAEPN